MSTEVVHCPLCDNQMFIDVPSCTVCGTPNPHWRSPVEATPDADTQEPEGFSPIEVAGDVVPATVESSAQAEGTPSSDDAPFISPEFDLSAFFAPAQEPDNPQSSSDQNPTLEPELDLSALFADFDSNDSAGEISDPVVAPGVAYGDSDTPLQEAPHYSTQLADEEGLQGPGPASPKYAFPPLFDQLQESDMALEQEVIESEKPAQPVTLMAEAEAAPPPVLPTSNAEVAEDACLLTAPLEAVTAPLAISAASLSADMLPDPNTNISLTETPPSEKFDGVEASVVSEEPKGVEVEGKASPPLAASVEPVLPEKNIAEDEIEKAGLHRELTEAGISSEQSPVLSVREAMPQGVPSSPPSPVEISVAEEPPATPAIGENPPIPVFGAEEGGLPLFDEQVEQKDAAVSVSDAAPEQGVGDLPEADLQSENAAIPVETIRVTGETTEADESLLSAVFDSEYNPDMADAEYSRTSQLEPAEAFVEEPANAHGGEAAGEEHIAGADIATESEAEAQGQTEDVAEPPSPAVIEEAGELAAKTKTEVVAEPLYAQPQPIEPQRAQLEIVETPPTPEEASHSFVDVLPVEDGSVHLISRGPAEVSDGAPLASDLTSGEDNSRSPQMVEDPRVPDLEEAQPGGLAYSEETQPALVISSPTGEVSAQLDAAALGIEPSGREELAGEAQAVETPLAGELTELASEPQISSQAAEEQTALREAVSEASQVEGGTSQQPQLTMASFDLLALFADVDGASSAPASVEELSTAPTEQVVEAPDENRVDLPTQESADAGYEGPDVVPAMPDIPSFVAEATASEQLGEQLLQEAAVTEAPSATERDATPYVIAPQTEVAPSSTIGAVAPQTEPAYRNEWPPLIGNTPDPGLSGPYADLQAPAVELPSTSVEKEPPTHTEALFPDLEQPEEATALADDAPVFRPEATEYAAFPLPPAQPGEPLSEQPPAHSRVDDVEPESAVASELDLSHLFEATPGQAVVDTVAPAAEEQIAPTQAMQVVRCRVCDNQMPVGVQFCQVCGSVMPQPTFYNEVYVEEPEPAVEEIAPEPQQLEPQQQAAQRIFTVPVQSERTPVYQSPVWEPGMPRPKPGTPEYEAMARAVLEQARSGNAGSPPPQPSSSQSALAPQPAENQPPPPQAPSWIPGMPRPKPGTPEYEAMARAALGQRDVSLAPAPPPEPAQSPVWTSGMPRPKPGTPEYEAMARAALEQARNGNSSSPQGSTPPGGYTPTGGQPADYFSSLLPPGAPRPKPGTPEYEDLVRRALNLQRGLRDDG